MYVSHTISYYRGREEYHVILAYITFTITYIHTMCTPSPINKYYVATFNMWVNIGLYVTLSLSSILSHWFYYRPQRSWGKVMFLQVSVILLTGGCLPQCMLGYTHTPRSRHPPEQTPPGADTPQSRPPSRHPLVQTPPQSRHTPPEQTP